MIDEKTVKKLSELSKISLLDDEISGYCEDLSRIIGMIDKIRETEINNSPSSSEVLKYAELDPDKEVCSATASKITDAKNNEKDSAFSVPKVV